MACTLCYVIKKTIFILCNLTQYEAKSLLSKLKMFLSDMGTICLVLACVCTVLEYSCS